MPTIKTFVFDKPADYDVPNTKDTHCDIIIPIVQFYKMRHDWDIVDSVYYDGFKVSSTYYEENNPLKFFVGFEDVSGKLFDVTPKSNALEEFLIMLVVPPGFIKTRLAQPLNKIAVKFVSEQSLLNNIARRAEIIARNNMESSMW